MHTFNLSLTYLLAYGFGSFLTGLISHAIIIYFVRPSDKIAAQSYCDWLNYYEASSYQANEFNKLLKLEHPHTNYLIVRDRDEQQFVVIKK